MYRTHKKHIALQTNIHKIEQVIFLPFHQEVTVSYESTASTRCHLGTYATDKEISLFKYIRIDRDSYIATSTKQKTKRHFLVTHSGTPISEETIKKLTNLFYKIKKGLPLQNAYIVETPMQVVELGPLLKQQVQRQGVEFQAPTQLEILKSGERNATPFTFNSQLGNGSNGIAFLYENLNGEKIILKINNENLHGDFKAQEQLHRQISQTELLAVQFFHGETQDPLTGKTVAYSIQPFIEGKSLEKLESNITLPIFSAFLDSIEHLVFHYLYGKKNMTHRDINPGNIHIMTRSYENTRQLRVAAVDTDNLSIADTVTEEQRFYKPFTPPEIFTSDLRLKLRESTMPWECWSLGCTAFYLLCNKVNIFEGLKSKSESEFERFFDTLEENIDPEKVASLNGLFSWYNDKSTALNQVMFGHALINAKESQNRVEILKKVMMFFKIDSPLNEQRLTQALLEIVSFFGPEAERTLKMEEILSQSPPSQDGWVTIDERKIDSV